MVRVRLVSRFSMVCGKSRSSLATANMWFFEDFSCAVTRGFLPSKPRTRMRNIRAASCMEQVKAPRRSYHQQMKRELPVTRCTECGGAGYNIRVANGRCCRNISERRCSGSNAIAVETVWSECAQCQATGYYRNKECPNCKGVGYLFVFFRDKTTA